MTDNIKKAFAYLDSEHPTVRAALAEIEQQAAEFERVKACNAQGDKLVVNLQARIAELEARSPAPPDGWKLVPVEPTMDMVIDGFESAPSRNFSKEEDWDAYEAMSGCQQAAHRARLCYAAMLAAVPSYEGAPNGGKA